MSGMQEERQVMQKELEAILPTVAQDWRKFNADLEAFKRKSEKSAKQSADEAVGRVVGLQRALRLQGELIFGIDYEDKERWQESFVLPSSPVQRAVFVHLFLLYLLNRATWDIINRGIERSPLQGDNLARAICKIFIRSRLQQPYIIARTVEMVRERFPKQAREEALSEVLTKYLATQLSLREDWRLGRALREDGRSAYERLLRRLPRKDTPATPGCLVGGNVQVRRALRW